MFHLISFPRPPPFGSCTITLRSPLGGRDLYVEAWLAADLSLLKRALISEFHCSVEQISFFLPTKDGYLCEDRALVSTLVSLPDRIYMRRLPIIGQTRLLYMVISDTDPPQRLRIRVETQGIPTPHSLRRHCIPYEEPPQ